MGHPDFGFRSNMFQGLKPDGWDIFLARLKPCPDTELWADNIFPSEWNAEILGMVAIRA